LEVLSLRVGIALAPVLDSLAGDFVALKWPNDFYIGDRKLGGVLIETRWRGTTPDWVAIGVGINVRAPSDEPRATGLPDGVSRLDVLDMIVGKLRIAASRFGGLSPGELATFATRDLAAGRTCSEPVRGLVLGIDESGALLVDVGSTVAVIRRGSLILESGHEE
jgi:BirA family biotin operon repressor/biotin-[acetyl-CoA-carboxylase] ligase